MISTHTYPTFYLQPGAHTLYATTETDPNANVAGVYWRGECACSNPDGDGVGGVTFTGRDVLDILDEHMEHLSLIWHRMTRTERDWQRALNAQGITSDFDPCFTTGECVSKDCGYGSIADDDGNCFECGRTISASRYDAHTTRKEAA